MAANGNSKGIQYQLWSDEPTSTKRTWIEELREKKAKRFSVRCAFIILVSYKVKRCVVDRIAILFAIYTFDISVIETKPSSNDSESERQGWTDYVDVCVCVSVRENTERVGFECMLRFSHGNTIIISIFLYEQPSDLDFCCICSFQIVCSARLVVPLFCTAADGRLCTFVFVFSLSSVASFRFHMWARALSWMYCFKHKVFYFWFFSFFRSRRCHWDRGLIPSHQIAVRTIAVEAHRYIHSFLYSGCQSAWMCMGTNVCVCMGITHTSVCNSRFPPYLNCLAFILQKSLNPNQMVICFHFHSRFSRPINVACYCNCFTFLHIGMKFGLLKPFGSFVFVYTFCVVLRHWKHNTMHSESVAHSLSLHLSVYHMEKTAYTNICLVCICFSYETDGLLVANSLASSNDEFAAHRKMLWRCVLCAAIQWKTHKFVTLQSSSKLCGTKCQLILSKFGFDQLSEQKWELK